MPELRHLHVPNTSLSTANTDGQFLAPLAAGSPKLEVLAVFLGSLTKKPLFSALRSFDALTSLCITDLDVVSYLWDQPNLNLLYVTAEELLRFLWTDPAVCPALRDIDIAEANMPENIIFVLAFGRFQNGNPIGRIHVRFRCPRPTTSPVMDLRTFASLGIDISLEYVPDAKEAVLWTPWDGSDENDVFEDLEG